MKYPPFLSVAFHIWLSWIFLYVFVLLPFPPCFLGSRLRVVIRGVSWSVAESHIAIHAFRLCLSHPRSLHREPTLGSSPPFTSTFNYPLSSHPRKTPQPSSPPTLFNSPGPLHPPTKSFKHPYPSLLTPFTQSHYPLLPISFFAVLIVSFPHISFF